MQCKILLLLVSFVMTTPVFAKSISQSWSIGGLNASYWAGEIDQGVSLIVNLETGRLVDVVESRLYSSPGDSSDWVWLVNVTGSNDHLAEPQSLTAHSRRDLPPIFYQQSSFLGWRLDEERGRLIDTAGAEMVLTPSTLISTDGWFYGWEVPKAGGVEHFWGTLFEFHGSFGPGPDGDELGRQFFDLPEPPVAAILLLGIAALSFRCRSLSLPLLLSCCGLLLASNPGSALATGGVSQASGFDDHQAWSSLVGEISTDSTNHGFSIWTGDDGVTNWGLSLGASGHYGSAIFPQPRQTGEFIYESLHLVWNIVAPGPWYTTARVTGGRILSQHTDFGPLENGAGWLAGVYITGIIMPEPATTGLLGLGMLLGLYWKK